MIISVISLLVGLLIGLVVMDIGYNQKINSMKTYIIEQKKIINKKDKSLVETIYILHSIKRFIKNEKGFIKNLKPVPVSKLENEESIIAGKYISLINIQNEISRLERTFNSKK